MSGLILDSKQICVGNSRWRFINLFLKDSMLDLRYCKRTNLFLFRNIYFFCSIFSNAVGGSQYSKPNFYIHGSVHRESNLITVQKEVTYSAYFISVGSSTCFGC